MADRRIHQLGTASTMTGKYIPIDSSGSAEAEKIPIENLVDGTHTRCKTVVVTAGNNTITFSSPVPSTSYAIIVSKLVNNEGSLSGCIDSNKTVNGFSLYAMEDGTYVYYTTKEI